MKMSRLAMGLAFLAMSLGPAAASHADEVHYYTNIVGPHKYVHTYQGSTTTTTTTLPVRHAVKGYLPRTTSLPVSNDYMAPTVETNYSSVQAEVVGPNHVLRTPGDALLNRDIPNGVAGQMNPVTTSYPGTGYNLQQAISVQQKQPIVMTPASANYAQTLGVFDNGLTTAGVTTQTQDSNTYPTGSSVTNAASSSIFPLPSNATVGTPLPGQVPIDSPAGQTGVYYNPGAYYGPGYGYAYPSTSIVSSVPNTINGTGTPVPSAVPGLTTSTGTPIPSTTSTVVAPGTFVGPNGSVVTTTTTSSALSTGSAIGTPGFFPVNNTSTTVIGTGSLVPGYPIGAPATTPAVEPQVNQSFPLGNPSPFGVPNVPVRTR